MYVSRKIGVMKSKNNSARRDVRMQKVWKFWEKFLQHYSSQFKHCSQPSRVTNSYLAREYVSFYHHISLQVSCSSPGVPIRKKIPSLKWAISQLLLFLLQTRRGVLLGRKIVYFKMGSLNIFDLHNNYFDMIRFAKGSI